MADIRTKVIYGNIVLNNVHTERFEEQVRYDESNTDLLFHEFHIRVSTLVSASSQGGSVGASVGGANAVEMMANLEAALMHPRQAFAYVVGETTLLRVSPLSSSPYRDVNNGPKPTRCAITEVVAGRLFRINWEITCHVVLCGSGLVYDYRQQEPIQVAVSSSPILSNRWTMEEDRDEQWHMTRTWNGLLRVAHIDFNPNWLRHVITPQLTKGYKRTAMRYTATPDGLNLRYQITDRQFYEAVPWPAVQWNGQYKEVSGPGGRIGNVMCTVTMTGPPRGEKVDLLARAAEIVLERTQIARTESEGDLGRAILKSATITDYLGQNKVTVEAQAIRAPKKKDEPVRNYLRTVVDRMGVPLDIADYDPELMKSPGPYDGKSPVSVYIQYLQNPCGTVFGIPKAAAAKPEQPEPEESQDDDNEPEQDYGVGIDLQEDQDDETLSEEQVTNPYTYVEISNRYLINHGRVQIPFHSTDLSQEDDDYNTGAAPPDRSCVILSLHRPTASRVQHMLAERIGDWPTIPEPEATPDPNGIPERILKQDLLVHSREQMADGFSYMHRIEMRYTYALARAPRTDERLRAGSDPSDTTTPDDSTYNLAARDRDGRVE